MTDLSYSDFELFGLPQRFAQERAEIDARWKDLQREAHPDKFAAQGGAAQRVALQWSVRINEAYQRLKDPLRRAAYLCELMGAPIDAHSNTAMPGEFLMEQMDWREALDEADSEEELEALSERVLTRRREMLEHIGQLLDADHNPKAAAQQVRALMFIERFAEDVEGRLAQLGQSRVHRTSHVPAADFRTRRLARSPPAPHRGRHRPRHHPFAGRLRAPRHRRMPA
jgi:molecular chaperone HscB